MDRRHLVSAAVLALLGLRGALALQGKCGAAVAAEPTFQAPLQSDDASRPRASERALPTAAPSTTTQGDEDLVGVVVARATEVAPRFEGRLREVHVRLGDHVRAGAVIAEIDAPALRYDLRAAEAGLKTAGVEEARKAVELAQAKERLERRRTLTAEGLASTEELSAADYQAQLAVTGLHASQAQLGERRTQVERLRKENGDTVVVAPFEGIVAARYVDPGAMVRPSTPILRLVSMSHLFVRFAVPEARARGLAVGRPVRVRMSQAALELRGTVDKVAPEVDAASHMVFFEAALPPIDPGSMVLAGEVVRVSVVGAP